MQWPVSACVRLNIRAVRIAVCASFLIVTKPIFFEINEIRVRERESEMHLYGSLKFLHRNKNISQHNGGEKRIKYDDESATVNL